MFKVGDRVRRIAIVPPCHEPFMQKGHEYRVIGATVDRVVLAGGPTPDLMWNSISFELVKAIDKKPHKHVELIKAWADGAEIQKYRAGVQTGAARWVDDKNPLWSTECDYRIKPGPKPDVVVYYELDTLGKRPAYGTQEVFHNTKATFNGETGELKAVELI